MVEYKLVLISILICGSAAASFKTIADDYGENKLVKVLDPEQNKQELQHKHRHGGKDYMHTHNEVDPKLQSHTTWGKSNDSTELTTSLPVDDQDILRAWISSIPQNILNMRNRMRLATIFLESDTKNDVIDALARAGGNEKLHHARRRFGSRRRIRKLWPVPYHPIVRFAKPPTRMRYGPV